MRSLFGISAILLIGWTAFAQSPCERLKSLSLPNTTITTAEAVPAGPFRAPVQGPPVGAQEPITLAGYCRVAAVLTPTSDSHI